MATNTIKTRIKHRIDSYENWAALQTPPLAGELIIYKSNTVNMPDKVKIGDGVTLASNLPFITDTNINGLAAGIIQPGTDIEDDIPANVGSETKPTYFANGVPVEIGYSINKDVPANAVFTDTKVTSAGNHYTPETNSSSAINVDASSTTAATWGTTSLVTGVNLTRDAKGHVTGMTVDSIRMPSNPDSGNTTYTLSGKASGNTWVTTLTPSSGSATTSTVPAATTSAAGLMTAAMVTKLNGIAENANNYTLPAAGTGLGGVKTGGVATISNGVITAIASAAEADHADNADYATEAEKVSNLLTIKGNGTGISFDGSEAKNINIVGSGKTTVSGNENGTITIASSWPTASDLGLSSAMKFGGVVTSLPSSSTAGTVVILSSTKKEYVYDTAGNWVELGDEGSYALNTIQVKAGSGLTGGGAISSNVTLSHADTSSVSNLTASGRKYVTGLTFDTYGHVTGVTTGTETVVDTDTGATSVEVTGSGNAITSASYDASTRKLTLTKGATYNNYTYTLPVAKYNTLGGVKPAYSTTNAATLTTTAASNTTTPTIAAKTTTSGRYYGVEVDKNGVLFVNVPWTDNNTQYSSGTGISISGSTINHSNSVTAGTAQGGSGQLSHGGTFTVPTITYDAQGHITGKGTTTYTLPTDNNTDTKVTQSSTTSSSALPILTRGTSWSSSATTTTANFASAVTITPSTGTVTATKFSGNGNALTNLNALNLVTAAGDELILDCN